MKKKQATILIAAALLFLCSCAKEGTFSPKKNGEPIAFSSFRQQVFTRADIESFNFDPETKYTLLAVRSAASEADYAWDSGMGFFSQPAEGVEGADNKITYSPMATYPDDGAAIDFYGLTYSSKTTAPSLDADVQDGVTPTITLSDAAGPLPDLMHCMDAKGKTSADGIVLLPFEHALAALNFLIACEDDKSSSTISVKNASVTDIKLTNVAKSATMNVVTGAWSRIGEAGERVIFSGNERLEVSSDSQTQAEHFPIGPKDFLVFPNRNGSTVEQAYLTISLTGIREDGSLMNNTLENGVVVTNGACTITVPIYDTSVTTTTDIPQEFERNHKYTLSILVSHSKVRIVAVSPQVLEWVDVEPGTEHMGTLGQPVTFGNRVWMDRNLGASNFDCENDFYHTMGYYYQFGRNIPYILDIEVLKKYLNDPTVFKPMTSDDLGGINTYFTTAPGGSLVFGRHTVDKTDPEGNPYKEGTFGVREDPNDYSDPLFYTYDEQGNKISTWRTAFRYLDYDPSHQTGNLLYPALNPGDPGGYAFSVGPLGRADHDAWSWNRELDLEAPTAAAYRDYWGNTVSNPSNQPAPKGWQIATRADVYSILPEVKVEHWGVTHSENGVYKVILYQGNTDDPATGEPTAKELVGDYDFQYIAGRIRLPEGHQEEGLKPIPFSPDYPPCVYGIKHQGTNRAYRIRIQQHPSKTVLYTNAETGITYYFNYVTISRYPAKSTDRFLTDLHPEPSGAIAREIGGWIADSNLESFDWDNPAAEIHFPMQGYIDAGHASYNHAPWLDGLGLNCIMRVTEWQGANPGYNHTMYFRNQGVGTNTGSRNALGDPIRLVRVL